MGRVDIAKRRLAENLEVPDCHFLSGPNLQRYLGVSLETMRKYRKSKWIEGLHFVKQNERTVLYCWPLILDWVHNQHDPAAHQRAIAAYQAKLPSNWSLKQEVMPN